MSHGTAAALERYIRSRIQSRDETTLSSRLASARFPANEPGLEAVFYL